ncbi:MAG: proprotein convertase P-domain-containing protein, partial [Saprospiraceae bacterium]
MNGSPITDCDGFFFDSGSGNSNYSPNESLTTLICSDMTSGTHVSLTFAPLDIGDGDFLCFYDGTDDTAPQLACNADFPPGQPLVIQATAANPSGCIYATFVSNASGEGAGWSADINCVPSCQTILVELAASTPAVAPVDTGWIDICPGDRVDFTGMGIYPQDGIVYNHSDANSIFEWDFGDGAVAVGPITSHIYENPGGYVVQLTITDPFGCQNINFLNQRIRVSTYPDFNLTGEVPTEICAGDTLSLGAAVNLIDSTQTLSINSNQGSFPVGGIRSDSLALPDGDGTSYSTTIAFNNFSPGQVLTNINDLESICVNMEHSWMRDLEITLTCPDGTSIVLHDHPGQTGGQVFLGEPIDNDGINPTPGQGYDYCWTPNATNGTWIEYSNTNNPGTLPEGDYSTVDPITDLLGCPLNGEWTITVEDLWAIDNGFIFSWSINFRDEIFPELETFTPEIIDFGWLDDESIIVNSASEILAIPENAGVASYTFFVMDNFGCNYDTTVVIDVLPASHPNCFTCDGVMNELLDTTICTSESVFLNADVIGGLYNRQITFEARPDYPFGFANHPPSNPYVSVIDVNSIRPLVLADASALICSVCVDLETNFNADISLFLESPSGQILELSTFNGGSGDDYNNTCFSPSATVPITSGFSPFSGTFLPEGDWSDLDGSTANGEWKLRVSDAFGLTDVGLLKSWSICFNFENDIDYTWTPTNGLSCVDCSDPLASPATDTEYIVVALDDLNCEIRDTVRVDVVSAFAAPVFNTCVSQVGGTISVDWNPVMGATNYEIQIDGGGWVTPTGANAHLINGLINNQNITIELRVNDGNSNCPANIATTNCTYFACDLIVDTVSTTAPSCWYADDGQVIMTSMGGTAPINYSVDGSPFTFNGLITSLSAGEHLIVAQDGVGCLDSVMVDLVAPDSIEVSIVVDSISCAGADDGMATASSIGGSGMVNYFWNTIPATFNATATDLGPQNYTVTATDEMGCSITQEIEVFAPAPLFTMVSADSVNCNGGADGTATAMPGGGTLPYTYLWSDTNGQTTVTATGLTAQVYVVTVTDANACSTIFPVQVEQPPALVLATDQQDANCLAGNDGTATVIPSGGVGPYTYLWDDTANQTTAIATGLTANTYSVTVTDSKLCVLSTTVTVGEPTGMSLTGSTMPTSCADALDGTASIIVMGGSMPYNYLWDDPMAQTNSTATGLGSGAVSVTITDDGGCTRDTSFIIISPTPISLVMDSTAALCFNTDDGFASVAASGGNSNYTYLWNDPAAQTTSTASNLLPGEYCVTVTDITGCTATDCVMVDAPTALVIDATNQTPVSCNGGADGMAQVTVSGGNGGFTYLWNDPLAQFSNPAINLTAGMYEVTISDQNSCAIVTQIEVLEPDPLTTTSAFTNVTCFGGNDGTAVVTPTGGNTPYTYTWSNATNDSLAINLAQGNYTVTITDATVCSIEASFTINQPATGVTAVANQSFVGCNTANQGEATAVGSGGTGTNYTYLWSDAQTTATAVGLGIGNFTVTVSDENACTATATVSITEEAPIVIETAVVPPSCFGDADGQIGITDIMGGVGAGDVDNYTYQWNTVPTQSTPYVDGLAGGTTYTVTVTDAKGCSVVADRFLAAPAKIQLTSASQDVSCFGLSDGEAAIVDAQGSHNVYTYQWDSNAGNQMLATAMDLTAGTYSVTVTDSTMCSVDTLITVSEPTLLGLTFDTRDNLCTGDTIGAITIEGTGGT